MWAAAILLMIASGCATGASDSAMRDVLAPLMTEHAAALAEDGGPRSLATGRRLIATFDAMAGAR